MHHLILASTSQKRTNVIYVYSFLILPLSKPLNLRKNIRFIKVTKLLLGIWKKIINWKLDLILHFPAMHLICRTFWICHMGKTDCFIIPGISPCTTWHSQIWLINLVSVIARTRLLHKGDQMKLVVALICIWKKILWRVKLDMLHILVRIALGKTKIGLFTIHFPYQQLSLKT